jgi:hypothetical protein
MSEQKYDEIIAPMLAEIAKKCQQLGMNLIARVEWEPGEAGVTEIGIGADAGIAQKLTQLAANCRGNIDAFCIEAIKRFDCSQSIVLASFQNDQPDTRSMI